jgi:UDP-glucose 4-epimerase
MVLNVGTGRSTSVNDLFEQIKEGTNSDVIAKYSQARTGEIHRSLANQAIFSKTIPHFKFTDIQTGLKSTIASFIEDHFNPDNN